MILLKPKFALIDDELFLEKDIYIGIEDGKFVYIGKEKPEDYDEIIELRDHIIIPSFINSHTHVAMTLLRGLKDDVDLQTWLMRYILPAEKKLKPSDVYYGALYGIAEMIMTGTTMFLDMYYHELEIAKATIDAGIRSMVTYGSADIFFNISADEEFKKVLKFKTELDKLVKEKQATTRIFFALGPHSPYGCSKELLEIIRDYSNENNLRIHIHLSETKWEVETIKQKTGKTPIEYLDSLNFLSSKVMAAHVVWPTENDLKILARRGVHVLHNPTSNLKLASGIAPIPKMIEYKINVALATDGPASNNRLDLWKEMHLVSLIHKGYILDPTIIPAKLALKMATINGAKALGLETILGSIRQGKYADFIVINLKSMLESTPSHDIYSMLVYALDSRSIESVWVNGKIVYSKKEGHKFINTEKLRKKIQDIRNRLLEEINTTTKK